MENNQSQPSDNELPMIGELGANDLLQKLTSTGNPLQAIVQFRNENGLHTHKSTVGSFMPVVELNDLQGKPRRDFYKDILDHFLQIMMKQCKNATVEQRQLLLNETFPYIGFKELQKLPFSLLEQTPNIPIAYLNQLSSKKELYEVSPLPVRRQIWIAYPKLLLDKLQPIFDEYLKSSFTNRTTYDQIITPKTTKHSAFAVCDIEKLQQAPIRNAINIETIFCLITHNWYFGETILLGYIFH